MIALLFAPVSRADDGSVSWLTDLDAALQKARAEKKLVVAYVRSGCGPCMVKPDKAMAAAETHAPILHLERNFVLVRIDIASPSAAVKALADKDLKLPVVAALDGTGEVLTLFPKISEPNLYTTWLSDLRTETKQLVRSGERRVTDPAEADLILGDVQMRLGLMREGLARFTKARERFEKSGKADRAEFAQMYVEFSSYLMMRQDRTSRDRALIDLMRLVNSTKWPENAADGWVAIGVIRYLEHDRAGAARAYRRALELAKPDSEAAAAARSTLRSLGETVIEVPAEASATTTTIRVVPPPRASITGRANFVAVTAPHVAKVAFFLDGAYAAVATKAPFQARLDVGSPPRLRTIKAIAYDRAGAPVGEAITTINDQIDLFRVSIISPVTETLTGTTTIEADAQVPEGRRLTSLELFWNDEKVATLEKPPFRHQLQVPNGFGYLRAVATLDDGVSAEDTRTYNSSGFVANVEVAAVNFAATVVDRAGDRVPNLVAKSFAVRDEGKPVELTVRDNPEEPVTIGLAIDASASMRPLLLDVLEIADLFVQTAVTSQREKMFVVAFDELPHVVRSATSDVSSLQNAVFDIRPAGGTSLYDAIAFSLQQFRNVGGKRALVVLTDAREGASQQSAEVCIRMARETGVPIYVVVPPFGNMSRFGSALENITSISGGLVVYGPKSEQLPAIFQTIRAEILGQYLLSFVAASDAKPGTWRRITVEVPNAKVRTVSGYYAR
ncbi:MAG TPA: VWA domain-containing protein [Thermoanaerobaculia bacterium]|nr:VWA domain-containing protein [Thermoanaerobaculia bacterium]